VGVDDVTELTDPSTDPLASDLVVACEAAWRSIQANHPELPPVVMLLGTGVERGRLVKLGHWWEGRWLADGNLRGEVLLAGEALHLKPEDVFEVLLHEAAHGINAARNVKDTSRGGRYHNARFKKTAVEVGLTVEQMNPYGFAKTSAPPETATRYSTEIDELAAAMRIARRVPRSLLGADESDQQIGAGQDGDAVDGEAPRAKVKPAECGCGRRMRMAPSVLAKGPVTCGVCGSEFVVDHEATRDRSFFTVDPADGAAARPPTTADRTTLTDSATVRAERLLAEAGRAFDGLDVVVRLGAWRGAFDTDAEHPIPVATQQDVGRWEQLARAVLTVDGWLTGPSVELRDELEVRAGDRLIVEPSEAITFPDDLPEPGTPGVVVSVRPTEGLVMVDFATAGVYAVAAGTQQAAALRYDYCEVEPAGPEAASAATEAAPSPELDTGIEP